MRRGRTALGAFKILLWGLSALAAGEEKVLALVGEEVITVEELPQVVPMVPALYSHGDA